jgi:GDP-L-fucose synthase
MNIENKTVVVTGANGLVGLPTVRKCLEKKAKKVYAVDLRFSDKIKRLAEAYPNQLELIETDLTYLHNCEKLFQAEPINAVLHIAGIKGSPSRTAKSPADYVVPMLLFNTNMIKASFEANVDWFVYFSSVGVYSPADVMVEDSVWSTMPSKNDWHPGWAKRMGELTLDAMKIQHEWDKWTILRPSNIYGPNDNFSPDATVISSNIWKIINVPGDLTCWGDGSPKRDFVYSEDVADATISSVENEVHDTVNVGCGEAVSIKETIETIVTVYEELHGVRKNIVWDTSKPNGDMLRRLSTERQAQYNLLPKTSLYRGIKNILQEFNVGAFN